jgi:hypothetical protein
MRAVLYDGDAENIDKKPDEDAGALALWPSTLL